MNPHDRIFVAGGHTLLGGALVRVLREHGFLSITTEHTGREPDAKLDLTDARAVDTFFEQHGFAYVFDAAGDSGGIGKNRRMPATLMLDNLLVVSHLVASALRHRVKKFLFLASSCSYPRDTAQPMVETALFTGPLEPTNEAYAVSKLAGIKLCEAVRIEHGAPFISAIPANAFGIGDDYSLEGGHVIAAVLARAHAAKLAGHGELRVWGTGKAVREFIFADDVADACVHLMTHYDDAPPINIGSNVSMSIADLVGAIVRAVGFQGQVTFDPSHPDGMPKKQLDSTRIQSLGWMPRTSFADALEQTYRAYTETHGTSC